MVRRPPTAVTGKLSRPAKTAVSEHVVEIGVPVDLGITMSICSRGPQGKNAPRAGATRPVIDCRVPMPDVFPTEH